MTKSKIIISDILNYDAEIFFVDRLGKFGSYTWEYDSFEDAYFAAEEIVKRSDVLYVYIWS